MRSLAFRPLVGLALIAFVSPFAIAISDGDGGFNKPPALTAEQLRQNQRQAGPQSRLLRQRVEPGATVGNCPSIEDVQGWTAWRDLAITRLLSPRKRGLAFFLDPDQVSAQGVAIANTIDDCAGTNGPKDALKPVLANLALFSRTQRVNADTRFHQFGQELKDAAFLDLIRSAVDLPPLLRQENFLMALTHPSTYKDPESVISDGPKLGHAPSAAHLSGTARIVVCNSLRYAWAVLSTVPASRFSGIDPRRNER